jgi:hypothetical protein
VHTGEDERREKRDREEAGQGYSILRRKEIGNTGASE